MQGTFLYQDGSNRTFTLIQLRLDDKTSCITVRVCLQLDAPLQSEGSSQAVPRYLPWYVQIPERRWCFRPSPPESVRTRISSCFTLSILALGLSILLIATMISTPAAFAWLIASTVCGITPSSAATTRIAISVDFAPRIRIAVNASCPGVSRNVIFCPLISTMYAPMCWVIPPASFVSYIGLADCIQKGGFTMVNVTHNAYNRRTRLPCPSHPLRPLLRALRSHRPFLPAQQMMS